MPLAADPDSASVDTLTCGVCQKDFALADIVKFIQHKVLTCNKENHPCKSKGASAAANESDGESNNNSADADKPALENGEKGKGDEDEKMDEGEKRAAVDDEAEGASSSSDKENSASATDAAAASEEGAKADPESSPGLTSSSSAKSPSSPVTSTPDSSARKRKAACVDADTNTVITGKHRVASRRYHLQGKKARRRRRIRPSPPRGGPIGDAHVSSRPSVVISGDLWFSSRAGQTFFLPSFAPARPSLFLVFLFSSAIPHHQMTICIFARVEDG